MIGSSLSKLTNCFIVFLLIACYIEEEEEEVEESAMI